MPRSAAPGVTLRSNGAYWQYAWRDSTGHEVTAGGGSKRKVSRTAALAKGKELERKHILAPRSKDARNAPTLAAWLDEAAAGSYWHTRERPLAESSLVNVRETAGYLLERLGANTRLDQVTRRDAALWVKWLADKRGRQFTEDGAGRTYLPLSDQTVCSHIRRAKSIFKQAFDQDLVEFNPFDRLSGSPTAVEKSWYQPPDDVVERLLAACPDGKWRRLVALVGYAGLRKREALLMERPDVKWDQNRLSVREPKDTRGRRTAKTVHKRRDVLMVPELERALLEQWEEFPGDRLCPQAYTTLDGAMRDVIVKAGLTGWTTDPFKTLRRWRASTWRLKYPEPFVDAWLGHSQAVARAHYVTVPESLYSGKADLKTELAEALRKLANAEARLAKAG